MCTLSAVAIIVLSGYAHSAAESSAPSQISKLHTALASGDLVLTEVRGTGQSSGTVLEGLLENTTSEAIRISTRLSEGLYLENRNDQAQNMMATGIYERGGLYYVEGNEPFIEVLPQAEKRVTFLAYCVDFERENPRAVDQLIVRPAPPDLSHIIRNIMAYEQANQDSEHLTVRVQVALWLAQGLTAEEIREKFTFTHVDLYEALRIVAGEF